MGQAKVKRAMGLAQSETLPEKVTAPSALMPQKKKVMFLIPAGNAQMQAPTVMAVFSTLVTLIKSGWEIEMDIRVGDADLARARNYLMGCFLASDCSHALLIDADISWDSGAVLRMLDFDMPFVAAVYRMRMDDAVYYPVHWPENKRMIRINGNPLLQAQRVPAGFLLLKREVIQRIADALPRGQWFFDQIRPSIKCPWIFDFEFHGTTRLSEDYVLCKKWTDLGGEIWVDPAIAIGHTGMKTFDGHLATYLQEMMTAHIAGTAPGMAGIIQLIDAFIGPDKDALEKMELVS
jgi:hypothetical protein